MARSMNRPTKQSVAQSINEAKAMTQSQINQRISNHQNEQINESAIAQISEPVNDESTE